jgi:TonB family protein
LTLQRLTLVRKVAQLASLALVFVLGTGIVFSQDTTERKVIKKIEPEYPSVLREKGIGGTVRLKVTVRADGTVKDVQTVGGNAVLVESATRAVKQWRYAPAEREATIELSIHFGQH